MIYGKQIIVPGKNTVPHLKALPDTEDVDLHPFSTLMESTADFIESLLLRRFDYSGNVKVYKNCYYICTKNSKFIIFSIDINNIQ